MKKVCISGIQSISLSHLEGKCYEAQVFVVLVTRRKPFCLDIQPTHTLWRIHFICSLQDTKFRVLDIAAFAVKLSHLLVVAVVVIEVMVVVLAF